MFNEVRNVCQKYGAKITAGAALASASVYALADGTDPFSTTLTTITTNVGTYITGLGTLVAASVAGFVAFKYIKKIVSKA